MDNTLAMTINDISSEWRKASSLAGTGPGADSDASNTGMDALGLDFADALSSSTSGALSDSSESPGPLFSPPHSHAGSVEGDSKVDNTSISVSTTFFPGANIDSLPTNLIILSSDSVFFYVNSKRLLSSSSNGFNHLLPVKRGDSPSSNDSNNLPVESDPILNLPDSSVVLNIILHTIHDMSCSHYCPSLADLTTACSALRRYGISIQKALSPSAPLTSTILQYAPTQPIDVYALAAKYDLYDLGAATSSHLLGFQLPTLTDEMAERIGAKYLKKLFFLHLGRSDALKRLIINPPQLHAPTPQCDFGDQKRLTSAWALAAAYVTWDMRPDMSASSIESSIRPLMERLTCETCKASMNERIKEVVVQWSLVKRTI